jgi:hypothetical protein
MLVSITTFLSLGYHGSSRPFHLLPGLFVYSFTLAGMTLVTIFTCYILHCYTY